MHPRTLIAVALVCLTGARAHAQMGPNLDLTWNTLDSGGGTSTGGGFILTGTIGQADAGTATGGGFDLLGGFWGGPSGPPPCYPDCNASGTLSVAAFGCFQTQFVVGCP